MPVLQLRNFIHHTHHLDLFRKVSAAKIASTVGSLDLCYLEYSPRMPGSNLVIVQERWIHPRAWKILKPHVNPLVSHSVFHLRLLMCLLGFLAQSSAVGGHLGIGLASASAFWKAFWQLNA